MRQKTETQPEIDSNDNRLSLFINKCKDIIKGKTYLSCSFGPLNRYKILRDDDTFILQRKGAYFTSEFKDVGTFKDKRGLCGILTRHPEMYAENAFSHQLKHWDNWTNFLEAFKIKNHEKNQM